MNPLPAAAPPRPPGPLAGLLLGALLGVGVFLAAALVHDRLLRDGKGRGASPAFVPGGDARTVVRVLATLPGSGLQAALVPLREDGVPGEAEAALLDDALFPGEEGHRWARLLLSNPRGGKPFTLALGGGALRLEGGGGQASVDLAAAFEARRPSLSPHRVMDLAVARIPEASVEVPPGEFVRVLVAFPREADLGAAVGLSIPGGPRLRPREVATEALRTALFDGRVGDLPEAVPAEARGGPEGGR